MMLIYTTFPNRKAAVKISREILQRRLAGCVVMLPATSQYWWRGKIEKASEVVLLVKTVPRKKAALKKFIALRHPYEIPLIVEIPLRSANPAYRQWLKKATAMS